MVTTAAEDAAERQRQKDMEVQQQIEEWMISQGVNLTLDTSAGNSRWAGIAWNTSLVYLKLLYLTLDN